VGLLMLILIAFLPATFAIDRAASNDKLLGPLNKSEVVLQQALAANPTNHNSIDSATAAITAVKANMADRNSTNSALTYKFRKEVQAAVKDLKAIAGDKTVTIPAADKATLSAASGDLNKITDYAPVWVIATISISLGIGTMIGWKRIVLTIGEKIGKEHLSYAQGATAEIVAAATIGLSTGYGLPVSTTHVLSSGVAGAMVASGGTKNLNANTLKSIALAWVLTLPASILIAMLLFALFRLFI
jgi:PiT family inorganic phosphate transporter